MFGIGPSPKQLKNGDVTLNIGGHTVVLHDVTIDLNSSAQPDIVLRCIDCGRVGRIPRPTPPEPHLCGELLAECHCGRVFLVTTSYTGGALLQMTTRIVARPLPPSPCYGPGIH